MEEKVKELKRLIGELQAQDRYDLLLDAIGENTLERLQIEMARKDLSPLRVTYDYLFVLVKTNKTVELSPIQKALYLLFLQHEEGIEFKMLGDYRDELRGIYAKVTNRVNIGKMEDTIARITDPLDNAINENCSRIKAAFAAVLDKYSLRYYIIAGHTVKHIESSSRVWFERRKTIMLPRELVEIG